MHVTKGLLIGTAVMTVVAAVDVLVAHVIVLAQQAATGTDTGLGASVGSLSATAILGWYAWYTATTVQPRLIKDFREEMTAERIAHDARLRAMHDEHRADREAFLSCSRQLKGGYERPQPNL